MNEKTLKEKMLEYVDSVRNEIYEIMCKHNYIRILVDISQYDDWYVKKELLEN